MWWDGFTIRRMRGNMVVCYSLTARWTWEFICTYCHVFKGGIRRIQCLLTVIFLHNWCEELELLPLFWYSFLTHRYRHQNTTDFGQNMFFLASVAEQFHLLNSHFCFVWAENVCENTDDICLVKSEAYQFWLYQGRFWTVCVLWIPRTPTISVFVFLLWWEKFPHSF